MNSIDNSTVFGLNPVLEALKARKRRCYKIIIEQGKPQARLNSLILLAHENKVPIETIPKTAFQKKYRNYNHQGVIGVFAIIPTLGLEELIKLAFQKSSLPILVALDSIQDPQNLGAIIRSAEALGIHGIILPKNRTSAINETVAKCSSGAIEYLPISWVTNLTRGIEQLKKINKIKKNAIFLGIAYSFQKCQKIPTNKQDFKLDYIFTEKGIINSN